MVTADVPPVRGTIKSEAEAGALQQAASIRIMSGRRTVVLNISAILYVRTSGHNSEIHVSGGQVYVTRQSLTALERQLGADFIRIDRGCIVAVMAIHDITDQVNLVNGQRLEYALRNRAGLVAQLQQAQQRMIGRFIREGVPATEAEYRDHYRSFDAMPFAFADIEMVFDENRRAVDWIFRYANSALARLERLPLERLVGSSFGSLFNNMDARWLRVYERATLYREKLEIIDYSPEIRSYLKIICFPTFKGHCGCILFDISEIQLVQNSGDAQRALKLYLDRRQKFDAAEE